MELNEYQKQAMTTCMKSCDNFSYMMLNLVGEVGEFASKVAKHIRKGEASVASTTNGSFTYRSKAIKAEAEPLLRKEAGDILWQLAGLCQVMGWSLEDVAQENLDKLASRAKRNVIDGDGDLR